MYKVVFTESSYISINRYIELYRSYFRDLYRDSGIWQEQKIIDSYITESQYRYDAIIDTITHKLENNLVHHQNQKFVIFWKSKIIVVSYKEDTHTRIVTDIEIR